MKIKVPIPWEKERDETVAEYAERCLDGDDHDLGQLETIERSTDRNRCAIGRLLEVLASKGLLTAPEVTGVVDSYVNPDARFQD